MLFRSRRSEERFSRNAETDLVCREIEQFCSTRYQATFPLFEKTDVNGDNAHPLFKYLKHAAPGILGTEAIKWNFTKFLVDRKGQVVRRYGSADDPTSIANDIQKALQSPE